MTQYSLRETRADDGAALNALYRRLTGIDRSSAQYAWEWQAGPLGPAPSWVVIDEEQGRLVAHHGVIPVPLLYAGRPLSAARTENTMVDPDYRRRIVYHAYEARILSQLRDRFEVLFTTSGKAAWGAVRRHLGYRQLGTWRTFTLGATTSYLARRLIGRLAPARLPTIFSIGRGAAGALEETADLERVAALSTGGAAPAHGVHVARTPAYLKWRLVDHPYHGYRLALLTRAGRDEGFVAWREAPGPAGTVDVHLEDIFLKDAAVDAMGAWFITVARHWRHRPARILFRTTTEGPYADAARRIAPAWLERRHTEEAAALLVLAEDPVFGSPWWVTMLLAQGI
jgi:hypothetical protein